MTTLTYGYVDHSHDDDFSVFAMLAAVFAAVILISIALFMLRIIPIGTVSMHDGSSNGYVTTDGELVLDGAW